MTETALGSATCEPSLVLKPVTPLKVPLRAGRGCLCLQMPDCFSAGQVLAWQLCGWCVTSLECSGKVDDVTVSRNTGPRKGKPRTYNTTNSEEKIPVQKYVDHLFHIRDNEWWKDLGLFHLPKVPSV